MLTGDVLQADIDRLRTCGGGVLHCQPGETYVCNQPLSFDDVVQVTVDGARSRWVYTGPGDFISAKSAIQVTWRDVRVKADAGHTGHLVSTGWSQAQRDPSHLRFVDCEFVGGGASRACLRLDRAIFTDVSHCQFSGANWGILGLDGSYSNVTTIGRGCAFYSLNHAGIYNAGESWTIDGNGFEPLTNHTACAYSQDLNLWVKGFAFARNWCGDISANGGAWVSVRGAAVRIDANYFGSPGSITDPCVQFFGVQSALVTANHNQATGRFLLFRPEGGYSRNVTVLTNDLGIGAVAGREWCVGLRLLNNFGQADA